jgi:hypothetical protein
MCFSVSLRDDEVGHCPPDRLVARPAKDAPGAIIPIGDDPIRPHHNDRIKGGF